jgi:hypothetical protein
MTAAAAAISIIGSPTASLHIARLFAWHGMMSAHERPLEVKAAAARTLRNDNNLANLARRTPWNAARF